jgi:transcriptional regulator with XRE-family HTH domain
MRVAEDVKQVAELVRAKLVGQLAAARTALGLSQAELAERAGTNRMTVQRVEAEGGTAPSLSTFVQLALSLNMTPRLLADTANGDPDQFRPTSEAIVHRGYAFNRTKSDLEYRDRRREAALSRAWLDANADNRSLEPLMNYLVPQHTQDQASAAATAIQWLGSEQGFSFLQRALDAAGYAIVDHDAAPAKRRLKPDR